MWRSAPSSLVDGRKYGLKLFGTGIDDLPELFAVLDLLHLGGQPAVAADPVLHRIGIIRHQVGGPCRGGDLDAEGKGLVVIRLVEAKAGAWRHANLVHRDDAEHQRAGRIADAIDDDAFMAIADALILRLVFVDIAAVIAGDMQIGARRRSGQKRKQQQKRDRDAHGSTRSRVEPVGAGKIGRLSDQTAQLWPYYVGIWLSISEGQKTYPVDIFGTLRAAFAREPDMT